MTELIRPTTLAYRARSGNWHVDGPTRKSAHPSVEEAVSVLDEVAGTKPRLRLPDTTRVTDTRWDLVMVWKRKGQAKELMSTYGSYETRGKGLAVLASERFAAELKYVSIRHAGTAENADYANGRLMEISTVRELIAFT